MYKFLSVISFVCCLNSGYTQDVLSVNLAPLEFGTFQDHPDWTLLDEDGLANWYQWMSDSWGIHEEGALSCSAFNPAGQADNWMILPLITVPADPYLLWRSWNYAYWTNTSEDYEILISTTNTSPASFTVIGSYTETSTDHDLRSLDLSAYIGQNVYIAFRHIANDEVGFCVGEIYVGTKNDKDLECFDLSVAERDYYEIGTNIDVTVKLLNKGDEVINTVDFFYSINGASIQTETVNVNIGSFEEVELTHSTSLTLSLTELQELEVWVKNPNGGLDPISSNDTVSCNIYGLSDAAPKKVLIEKTTGTWCQYCPMGGYELQQILDTATMAIGVSIHQGDIMATDSILEFLDTYINAYPSATFDRHYFVSDGEIAFSRDDWTDKYLDKLNEDLTPLAVSFEAIFDVQTRELEIDLETIPYTDMDGKDLRFNVYIIEDSVTGGTDYDQANWFDTQAGSPYEGLGNPIVGFVHNHVLRVTLGGDWGIENSIPANIVNGTTYSHSVNYTLPIEFNYEHVKIVALVQEYNIDENNREIINAEEGEIDQFAGLETADGIERFQVFPNPGRNYVIVRAQLNDIENGVIQVSNASGEIVLIQELSSMPFVNDIVLDIRELDKGIYFVNLQSSNSNTTNRLIIQ